MQQLLLSPAVRTQSVGLETDDPLIYRAQTGPDRQAVFEVATGESYSYGELHLSVGRVAAFLLSEFGDGEAHPRIAFLGRNSMAQISICLACQRVGYVFVPLNWRLGAAELKLIIGDCQPALILHDAEFADTLANMTDLGVPSLQISGTDGLLARTDMLAPAAPVAIDADRPCVMLYTSGTTGMPKGVIITRRNAFASAINFSIVGEVTAHSVTLCDLPFFHTIGLIAIGRTTLMMGGRLVISDRFMPDRTLATLGDPTLGITHYFAVPQMAAALRAHPGWNPSAFKALQAIFIGGAPLSPALVETFLEDGIPLVNGYGMSEAGTAIHMPLDRAMVARHPGSVGFAAPLLDVRLVNEEGADVADGEVGEIWLRGHR